MTVVVYGVNNQFETFPEWLETASIEINRRTLEVVTGWPRSERRTFSRRVKHAELLVDESHVRVRLDGKVIVTIPRAELPTSRESQG